MGKPEAFIKEKSNKGVAFALLKMDANKSEFALKWKDTGLQESNKYLYGVSPSAKL